MNRPGGDFGRLLQYLLIFLFAARIPLAYLALTNFFAVVAIQMLMLTAAVAVARPSSGRILRGTVALIVFVLLAVEGLYLYPRIIVPDVWTLLLLSTGLLSAVLVTDLLWRFPLPVRAIARALCLAVAVALFLPVFPAGPAAWVVPVLVSAALLALQAGYVRLHEAQQETLAAHRNHATVSAKLAMASAEILDSRHRESLALIAAGIAHEVNNPMTYLRGNLELLEEQLQDRAGEPEIQSAVTAMKRGLHAISSVVDRVRSVYRESRAAPQRLRLRDPVELAVASLPRESHHAVSIHNDVDPELIVETHPGDVYIVLSNLLRNAVEACVSRPTAVIQIQAVVRQHPGGTHPGGTEAPAGTEHAGMGHPAGHLAAGTEVQSVEIWVSDTGVGMDREEIRKATDPFYSTKSDRGGMGVGLALVQAIAERTGAKLQIESTPGEGTTVRYRLRTARVEADCAGSGDVPPVHAGLARTNSVEPMDVEPGAHAEPVDAETGGDTNTGDKLRPDEPS